MLTVQVPPNFQPERNYILAVLLGEFLGIDYQVTITDSPHLRISNDDERSLTISDCFFATDKWLQSESLPSQPLAKWDLDQTVIDAVVIDGHIPVIYGDDPQQANFFERSPNKISLGLDIFGSSFFMLTRYEEVVKPDRDRIDRFPAKASLAWQEDFLNRPVVNEYLEILWWCLQDLWPGLERKKHQFQVYVSHDLDEPFLYAFTGVSRLIQRCAGDIIRRGSLSQAFKSVGSWYQVANGKPELDPYNTFDLIMDISEANNLKSAFYFITDHTAGSIDGFYDLENPLIRDLLRKIHARGHEIGLHTSFNTYKNPQQTKKEFERLLKVCEDEGIKQTKWGGRQHCLRWQTPATFQNWNSAGLDYDSTLVYAEKIGFRCGTCYEFSVFDLATSSHLKLKERPLTVMDATVIRDYYMNLPPESKDSLRVISSVKNNCKKFNGDFTLLWHNTTFIDSNELSLYQNLLS
jgi:peptidoglycan/xylan/chitin deacetylase (PgdA/CDA1 family)